MKFITDLQHVFRKSQQEVPEVYLALVIHESFLQGVSFELHGKDTPRIRSVATEVADDPTWDDRLIMADRILSKLDEGDDTVKMTKVIFGLGQSYLTKDGDIQKECRTHLKEITVKLKLSPLGYIPISSGIQHYLKRTEGVPPSVIVIIVSKKAFEVVIYRVGRLSSEQTIGRTDDIGRDIENALKSVNREEVLPSRMLLVGADSSEIESVKSILLKHQWTSHTNFLHYPKIDVFPADDVARAIADAGAGELTRTIPDTGVEDGQIVGPEKQTPADRGKTHEETKESDGEPEEQKEDSRSGILDIETALRERMQKNEIHTEKIEDDTIEQNFNEEDTGNVQKDSDVVVVPAAALGFGQEPSDEKHETVTQEKVKEYQKPTSDDSKVLLGDTLVRIKIFFKRFFRTFGGRKILTASLLAGGCIFGFLFLLFSVFPHATVTLTSLSKRLTASELISIDVQAASVSAEKKTIPGRKIEKVVTGEKTIPTTGTKKIGDPAKGTVIISNKTTGLKTFKKGTVILSGALRFTLDQDVSIASASEDFRGSTWGNGSVAVTAESIGPEGNIPANSKFTFKDVDVSEAVARNEQAFAGGVSKEVVVVSRADYDMLLKVLTAELIEKAKTDIAQSVSGKERLIEKTIKTTVTEKQYTEEIDQETKELHGKLTITVTANAFNEDDVQSILLGSTENQIPSGYSIRKDSSVVSVGDVQIGKDGRMTTQATLEISAYPAIDSDSVKKSITGKKLTEVEQILKDIPGISSVEFSFKRSLWKDRLPKNQKNITVVITTQ